MSHCADDKKIKPLTQKWLTNIALHYLERYESSSGHLEYVLKNRIFKEKAKGASIDFDEKVVLFDIINKARDLGYVNDNRFAANMVGRLKASGKSTRFIAQKLAQALIDPDIISQTLEVYEKENQDSEYVAARQYVRKKRLGFYRDTEKQALFRKKDLAAMARAGFSFEVAVKALQQNKDEDFYEL